MAFQETLVDEGRQHAFERVTFAPSPKRSPAELPGGSDFFGFFTDSSRKNHQF